MVVSLFEDNSHQNHGITISSPRIFPRTTTSINLYQMVIACFLHDIGLIEAAHENEPRLVVA